MRVLIPVHLSMRAALTLSHPGERERGRGICRSALSQTAGYLRFDDVIVPVDLQHVSTVTGDGAAGPVGVARAGALHLCVSDRRLLAVDGFAGVVDAAAGV